MSNSQNLLVTMQGAVLEVDVLEHFTVHLEHSAFPNRDIHYINSQSALSLFVRLELADSADIAVLREELGIAAKKYNLEKQINLLNEPPAVSSVYRYILTLLNQQLPPELLTKLLRQLRERSLHVAGISPLEADDLHVFEIEIYDEKPIDCQQLMHGLLELKSENQLDLALQADELFQRNKRFIFLDADMTFIQCEMINDMSHLAEKEAEVAEITHRAMDGK